MVLGVGLPELNRDEWVRGRWPARCLTGANGSSDGTLIITNRRVIFAGRSQDDELAAVDFDELTAVRCVGHGLSLRTLMVETSSGDRFAFRTKKMPCKLIEARSLMRLLAKG